MYPPNIANAAIIIHIILPAGHVFGTTGITVLFVADSSVAGALVSCLFVSLTISEAREEPSGIVNVIISHPSSVIICMC
jgi:hypothetical protein